MQLSAHVIVQRIFGRTPDKEKVEQFNNWFADNSDKLEEAIDEANPFNGQLLLDYQEASSSFIIEIQTTMHEFALEIKSKFEEMEFADSAIIGDVKNLGKGVVS